MGCYGGREQTYVSQDRRRIGSRSGSRRMYRELVRRVRRDDRRDDDGRRDGSNEGVRGTVTNVSDKTNSLVVVHVNPENDKEETLDRFEADSSESIDTLEPDATWDFEVVFDGDIDFTQYTIWATGQTEGNSAGTSNTTTANETMANETTTSN